MKQLENIIGNMFRKHPIISTFVAVKAMDLAIVGTAYAIWPEQTSEALHQTYNITKQSLPFAALCVANWPNEVATLCKNLPNLYHLI